MVLTVRTVSNMPCSLQALHAMEDMNSLCNAISSNRMNGPLDLRGAIILKPVASTTNGTRRSVKMWPQQAEVNWTNVHRWASSMHSISNYVPACCMVYRSVHSVLHGISSSSITREKHMLIFVLAVGACTHYQKCLLQMLLYVW